MQSKHAQITTFSLSLSLMSIRSLTLYDRHVSSSFPVCLILSLSTCLSPCPLVSLPAFIFHFHSVSLLMSIQYIFKSLHNCWLASFATCCAHNPLPLCFSFSFSLLLFLPLFVSLFITFILPLHNYLSFSHCLSSYLSDPLNLLIFLPLRLSLLSYMVLSFSFSLIFFLPLVCPSLSCLSPPVFLPLYLSPSLPGSPSFFLSV